MRPPWIGVKRWSTSHSDGFELLAGRTPTWAVCETEAGFCTYLLLTGGGGPMWRRWKCDCIIAKINKKNVCNHKCAGEWKVPMIWVVTISGIVCTNVGIYASYVY